MYNKVIIIYYVYSKRQTTTKNVFRTIIKRPESCWVFSSCGREFQKDGPTQENAHWTNHSTYTLGTTTRDWLAERRMRQYNSKESGKWVQFHKAFTP